MDEARKAVNEALKADPALRDIPVTITRTGYTGDLGYDR